MAGEHDAHEERIIAAIRALAGDDRSLDAPPPDLWGRIAGALDGSEPALPELTPPPPDLWDRIADEVKALGGQPEAETPELAPAPETAAPVPPAPPRPVATSAPDSAAPTAPVVSLLARRRTRFVLAVAAVAAALVLVVGVAVNLRRNSGTTTEVVAQAVLTGEGLDPGGSSTGSARLVQSDGVWKVDISADDLPPLAPDTFYEAWLLSSTPGKLQSLGTLDGDGGFVVPAGLDLEAFPLVDVSIEPLDGNPAHSTKSVLRGRLEQT